MDILWKPLNYLLCEWHSNWFKQCKSQDSEKPHYWRLLFVGQKMSNNSNKPDTSLEYRNDIVIENETMVLIPCGLRDYQKIVELANTYQIVRNPSKSENIKKDRRKIIEKFNHCLLRHWIYYYGT